MAETEKIGILKESWDIIRVRPPICYLPAAWEAVINNGINEMAREFPSPPPWMKENPIPLPWMIEKHMKDRINLVEKLVEAEKLDPKIGDIAKKHFETHLNELKAIQKPGH